MTAAQLISRIERASGIVCSWPEAEAILGISRTTIQRHLADRALAAYPNAGERQRAIAQGLQWPEGEALVWVRCIQGSWQVRIRHPLAGHIIQPSQPGEPGRSCPGPGVEVQP